MEIWKKVIGYEDHYEVSNLGNVRRTRKRGDTIVHRALKPFLSTHGYLIVGLCIGHVIKKYSVHRLVLSAFDSEKPRSFDVRHKDGSRTNNALQNLEWGSRSDNMMDAIAHGRTNRGQKHHRSKLDEISVKKIRADTRQQWKISADFGVGQSVISRIKSRKAWGWID